MNDILVSIVCLTYNHEKYIQQTLESFMNQKTNFNFEIIIHDDASTDNTKKIIMQYAEKFPKIIKPIFQKENQYSKGISIPTQILLPYIRGKYIAICEGDDYWVDNNKLQIQIDFLESNSEYGACVHNTYGEDIKSGEKKLLYPYKMDKDIYLKDVIEFGGQSYQSSSLVYKKEFLFNRPTFFNIMTDIGVEDYPLAIFLALNGKIRYIAKPMSVYRLMTENSWTKQNSNSDQLINIYNHTIIMLDNINEYTQFKYDNMINKVILRNEYKINELLHNFKILRQRKYHAIWNDKSISFRIKRKLYAYFGNIIIKIKKN